MRMRAYTGVILAVFMLIGVTLVPATAGSFEDLGIPVVKAGLMGSMVGPDATGANTMLYFNFNQEGAPMFIVQVDPETGQARQFSAPAGHFGGWGFIVGPDKKVYVGTWGTGAILCFDPRHADKGLYEIGRPSDTESYIWMYTIGHDRKLYGCTYGNAKLISYDPATDEMEDLGRMDPKEEYSRSVATGSDEWVYVGIGSVKADIVAFNTRTKAHKPLLPPDKRPDGWGEVFTGKDGEAYSRVNGQWYLLHGGTAAAIPEKEWPGQKTTPLVDGRTLLAADLTGHYKLVDPASGKVSEHSFKYAGAGSSIFTLGAGPRGVIYGSTAMPLELLSYDPATGKSANPGNPTAVGGEIYSFATLGDRLYLCAYPGSYLSRFDPAKPFHFGETPDSNPRGYGGIGEGHLRPRAMIVGPEGKLYIGSYPEYGRWGGGMGVWDPVQEKTVENYKNIITDQAICALAYDAGSGLVFGGSNIAGGGGTTPKATEAHFYVWDPVKKLKTLDIVPVRGDTGVISMCIAAGKVFIFTGGSGTLSVFDIAASKIVHQTPATLGRPLEISLQTRDDGLIYGLCGAGVFTVDPKSYAIKLIAKSPVPVNCGWAMTDTGIYFGSAVHLWRYKW